MSPRQMTVRMGMAAAGCALLLSGCLHDASSVSIVLPATPSWNEKYAAQELKYHLEKATGRDIPVVGEGSVGRDGRKIFVGAVGALASVGVDPADLELEERLVKGVRGDLYLVGGEIRSADPPSEQYRGSYGNAGGGTLYAVYDFLERDMGVSWIWPGELGEVIPKRADVPRLDGVERRGVEPLFKRALRGDTQLSRRVALANRLYGFRDAENARNEVRERRRWLTRMRCGSRRDFSFGHAFTDWHMRFADRPDLFARQPCGAVFFGDATNSVNKYYPLCVANPDVVKIIVGDWRRKLSRRAPGQPMPYVNCCENDSPGMCVCGKCRAWDAADDGFRLNDYWNGALQEPLGSGNRFVPAKDPAPSLTDRYVRFYNEVLKEARRVHGDAEVCAYAYANYVKPPKEAQVGDGVNISYVPSMIYPYGKDESEAFRRRWGDWNAMGARKMFYRPNYLHAHVNIPFSSARFIADDVNFAWSHGMIAIDQDSLLGAWSAQALDNFVVARLLREPGASYDKMLDEFLNAFGAAAEGVREYVRLLSEQAERFSAAEWRAMGEKNLQVGGTIPGGEWRNWFMNVADAYTEEWFARCSDVLVQAEKRVSGVEKARVRFLRLGLEDGHLTFRVRVAQKSGDADAYKSAFKVLQDYRASVESELVCAYLPIADREQSFAQWPHPCIRYYSEKTGDGDKDDHLINAL